MRVADSEHQGQVAVIFDLDKTITRNDTYLAFLIYMLRLHPRRLLRCAFLPVAVLLHKVRLRDNSWLKQVFLRAIAGGLPREVIEQCSSRFLEQVLANDIRPTALRAIACHRDARHRLVLATASFDFYSEEPGRRLGFDAIICTPSDWEAEHRLTGKIQGKNCYGANKLARLREYFGEQRGQLHLIGYSDHHTDAFFLQWVDQAVAVNPTPKLQKIARQQGFAIEDWENEKDETGQPQR